MASKPVDYLQMSDDDFLKSGSYPAAPAQKETKKEEDSSLGSNEEEDEADKDETGENDDSTGNADDNGQADDNDDGTEDSGDGEDDDTKQKSDQETGDTDPDADAGTKDKDDKSKSGSEGTEGDADKAGDQVGEDAATGAKASPEVLPEQAGKDLFQRLLASPIKANGKEITLKNVDEVVGLVQMGANYTRRMQELAPYRKTLMMLQKKELLDQDKLSYLIDLYEKKPEAIRKLVKDSGIDTLDLDNETNEEYTPTDHSVSDNAVAFQTTLEEVGSLDGGQEFIHQVNREWDENSKRAVWENPEILTIMHQQKALGVYDLIAAEVERQVSLGTIKPSVPFLQAYKTAGDALVAQGAFKHLEGSEKSAGKTTSETDSKTGQSGSDRKVIDRRAAAPKSQVANGDKAGAAGTQRTAGKSNKSQEPLNPLSMSDDEFLEKFRNRL